MVQLAHRNHKKSIWKWSGYHLKNWLSNKIEKVNKNRKNLKFENPRRMSLDIV